MPATGFPLLFTIKLPSIYELPLNFKLPTKFK